MPNSKSCACCPSPPPPLPEATTKTIAATTTIESKAPNPYFVKFFAKYSGLAGLRMRLGRYFFCVWDWPMPDLLEIGRAPNAQ